MKILLIRFAVFLLMASAAGWAASVPVDLSQVRPGPIGVERQVDLLIVKWQDERSSNWEARFSLDPASRCVKCGNPLDENDYRLIALIAIQGRPVVEFAQPLYWAVTGKRQPKSEYARGGWDAFPNNVKGQPPAFHPDGTRRFRGTFNLVSARARTVGDRVEVFFAGLKIGPFEGGIAYTFYPGSRLVKQEAVVSTPEPNVAYFYDAGIQISAESDRIPGRRNTVSEFAYFDTDGRLRSEQSAHTRPERTPLTVRYRALAVRTTNGSFALMPPPHKYFYARDFSSNLGYLWRSVWDGCAYVGVRQLEEDNTLPNAWFNAPPGTVQRMSLFLVFSDQAPVVALKDAVAFTNADRFPRLPRYKTLTTHWHFAYTEQALVKGFDWVPPFKPIFKGMGVNAVMLTDFHGDLHENDVTGLRLDEQDAYFRGCRTQSDSDFLMIPSEEPNVLLGGHYDLVFPKPVYWFKRKPPHTEFRSVHPRYGTVYSPSSARELMEMVRAEGGYVFQGHPRIKGSTDYPDKVRETEHFRDPRFLGGGWKSHPVDFSSPRLGGRCFKLLDEMNNWGLPKMMIGEVDLFQIDHTHEVYGHININYVKVDPLPDWDNYGKLVEAVARGEFFVTTGEVLLPKVHIAGASQGEMGVEADIRWTYPLEFAEVVWGDGAQTSREIFPLDKTRPFGSSSLAWKVRAKNWTWARLAVWDVAGNGAFINPVRR